MGVPKPGDEGPNTLPVEEKGAGGTGPGPRGGRRPAPKVVAVGAGRLQHGLSITASKPTATNTNRKLVAPPPAPVPAIRSMPFCTSSICNTPSLFASISTKTSFGGGDAGVGPPSMRILKECTWPLPGDSKRNTTSSLPYHLAGRSQKIVIITDGRPLRCGSMCTRSDPWPASNCPCKACSTT